MENVTEGRDWDRGFAKELADLRLRIDRFRAHELDENTQEALLLDLETAHEELRVADAEVRTQRDELSRLVQSQRLGRWQYERLVAIVPAPVLTTDRHGIIQSVNAAAAGMLNMRVDRILRKPIQAFVDSSDRPALRSDLNASVHQPRDFRRNVRLLPRGSEPVPAELVVRITPTRDLRVEVTWMILTARADGETGSLDRTSLASALVELTTLPLHRSEAQELVGRTAEICADALGDDLSVSISIGDPLAPEIVTSTSRLAQAVDGAQLTCREGPGLNAWSTTNTVTSADLRTDDRWPALAHRLEPGPATGVVAVAVTIGDEPVGTLHVYAAVPDRVDASVVEAAELFASVVAAIWHEVGLKAELVELASDLQKALKSRATIDQAKGIIMADRGCSPDEAFAHLVQLSSSTNVKLRDIAAGIVEGTWHTRPQ